MSKEIAKKSTKAMTETLIKTKTATISIEEPYHEGERTVQKLANEVDIADRNQRAFQKTIPIRAIPFIEQQAMVVIGSIDRDGKVWASILTGKPGFLMAHDEHALVLNVSEPRSAEDDPIWINMNIQKQVGLVIIELGSRRRLRVSGRAIRATDKHYAIEVDRAYPNCPKYIQRRQLTFSNEVNHSQKSAQDFRENSVSTFGNLLSDSHCNIISNSDTFFVASAHAEQGIDASHRGGHTGFVKVVGENILRIPDFRGNSMYNTLGNMVSYPKAGLVFIDFDNNRVLQLTGLAEILWNFNDLTEETGGTQRYWQFVVTDWRESALSNKLHWEFMDFSPHIPALSN